MRMLGWNLSKLPRSKAKPTSDSALESTSQPVKAGFHRPRRWRPKPALKQLSAREHAEALLDWIRHNVDPSEGPIVHEAILEFYCEMLEEQGWGERKWNPVAHQFRLLTTGRRKAYAWIQTATGTPHRLRVYPIPPPPNANADTVTPPAVSSSSGALKLRSAA